jgi:molybdate transport system regulatory protein
VPSNTLAPRLRVLHGREIALGPGKADLLEALLAAGTIRGAAARLGMSYMRAWTLIRTMNACFKEPLVDASRGGARHGTASLTPNGRAVLRLYRRMETEARRAAAGAWPELRRRLKP